jgi:hypothetical protein
MSSSYHVGGMTLLDIDQLTMARIDVRGNSGQSAGGLLLANIGVGSIVDAVVRDNAAMVFNETSAVGGIFIEALDVSLNEQCCLFAK